MFALLDYTVSKTTSCQTGQVFYDFHSPDGLCTHIGEWASANFKLCICTAEIMLVLYEDNLKSVESIYLSNKNGLIY